jgi:hypothetical protein
MSPDSASTASSSSLAAGPTSTTSQPNLPDLGSLATQLVARFTQSPEAQRALGIVKGGAEEAGKIIQDLFTLTVKTTAGQGALQIELITNWSLDGDVETTVIPNASVLTGPLGQLHMEQFKESLDYRLQLIEAVLSLAKIDVHLV